MIITYGTEFKLVDNLGETKSFRVLTYDDRHQVFVCRNISSGALWEFSMMYLADRAEQIEIPGQRLAHADTLKMRHGYND